MNVTFLKILAISLFMAAVFYGSGAQAGYYEIKPIVVKSWMNRTYLHRNYKYCKGKFYLKNVKCEWVKK